MRRLSSIEFAGLRCAARPDHVGSSDETLQEMVDSASTGMSAEFAEDFARSLGSLAKSVGGSLQQSAPSIVQGATSGASVGGPWGALIGAGAGLASAQLGSTGKPTGASAAAPTRNSTAPTPATQSAASTQTSASPVPALPSGSAAAAVLIGLFQDPSIRQALSSQVLGLAGNPQLPIAAGMQIPRAAINNLLVHLLTNAAESLPESDEITDQEYLMDESGEYLIDPASPEQQAALVLSLLKRPGRAGPRYSSFEEGVGEGAAADLELVEWLDYEESAESVSFYR